MATVEPFVFMTEDYPARISLLADALKIAQEEERKGVSVATDVDAVEQLTQELEALRAEAVEAGIAGKIAAVKRPVFRELRAKYPPRTGKDVPKETAEHDRAAGCNTDDIEDDLVYASLVEPKFKSRAAFDDWAAELSEGEWQYLVGLAWGLANGARLGPKVLDSSPTPSDD